MALVGDLVPINQRQVMIGRLLAVGLTGNVLGAAIDAASAGNPHVPRIYLSPRGELLTQAIVQVVSEAALFAIRDLENLLLESLLSCDLA